MFQLIFSFFGFCQLCDFFINTLWTLLCKGTLRPYNNNKTKLIYLVPRHILRCGKCNTSLKIIILKDGGTWINKKNSVHKFWMAEASFSNIWLNTWSSKTLACVSDFTLTALSRKGPHENQSSPYTTDTSLCLLCGAAFWFSTKWESTNKMLSSPSRVYFNYEKINVWQKQYF